MQLQHGRLCSPVVLGNQFHTLLGHFCTFFVQFSAQIVRGCRREQKRPWVQRVPVNLDSSRCVQLQSLALFITVTSH